MEIEEIDNYVGRGSFKLDGNKSDTKWPFL